MSRSWDDGPPRKLHPFTAWAIIITGELVAFYAVWRWAT